MERMPNDPLIRPFQPEDAPSLAHHANDIRVWLQLRDIIPHPYSIEDAVDYVAFAVAYRPQTMFAICPEQEAVGSIGLNLQSDINRRSAELGYWLGHDYWGRGLATRAVRAMTSWAIDELQLIRIFAMPFCENRASCRVLEKAGFVLEGVMRKSAIKNDRVLDQALYAYVV